MGQRKSTNKSPSVDLRRTDRRATILDVAARLFYERGYTQTSIRRIAAKSDVETSSLYYHFASKEEILFAVEEEAFKRLTEQVRASIKNVTDPWERLIAACLTHVNAVLQNREYISVTTRELPQDQSPSSQQKFLGLRERYEDIFREIIVDLPLSANINRKLFRLALIGALAGTLVWYRDTGESTPEEITRGITDCFRYACDPPLAAPARTGRTGRTGRKYAAPSKKKR